MKPWMSFGLLFVCTFDVLAVSDDEARFQLYGDLRARQEWEWDSLRPDGSARDDRDRRRGRIRFGLRGALADAWDYNLRLTSGRRDSQQSPHYDLQDSDLRDTHLDLYFARYRRDAWEITVGKQEMLAWDPTVRHELVWDQDVHPEGVALGYRQDWYQFRVGAYLLENGLGSTDFGDRSSLVSLGARTHLGNGPYNLKLETTLLSIRDNADAVNPTNLDMDYTIGALSLLGHRGNTRARFDVVQNFESYDDGLINHDAQNAWFFTVIHGKRQRLGDWSFVLIYAYVEQHAVDPYFAGDDMERWGASGQTRASNYKGTEFQVRFQLSPDSNVFARWFSVDGIHHQTHDAVALESGDRLRFDWNYRFSF